MHPFEHDEDIVMQELGENTEEAIVVESVPIVRDEDDEEDENARKLDELNREKEILMRDLKHFYDENNEKTIATQKLRCKLQTQSEEHRRALSTLQGKVQELNQYRATLELTLREQRNINNIINDQLQKCKDDLFGLQPTAQPTDAELCAEFDSLCNHITDWVDTELAAFDRRPNGAGHPPVAGANPYLKALLGQFDLTEHVLVSAIHDFVQIRLFNPGVILFGLSPKGAIFLQQIETHMAKLEPHRDASTINAWRSETLHASAMLPEFKRRRDQELQSLTTQLFKTLLSMFPSLPRVSRIGLRDNVVLPAAHLEARIHQSSNKYVFGEMHKLGDPFQPISRPTLKTLTCQDVKSKRIVKLDSLVVPDGRGNVGTPLIQKEPSFQRVEGDATIVLRQARWVLDFHVPILKQGRKAARG